jgi:hypothetical protein
MPEFDDEISFTEYILVLWKRKWLLIIPTVIIVLITAIYSLVSPKIWRIESIIQPSKFLAQSAGGSFSKVTTVNPRQLAGQIEQSSYNQLLARQMNININEFPRLRAEHLDNTDLVLVSTNMSDTETAKSILIALYEHIKFVYDKKIDTELQGIDSEISEKENEIKEQELILREKENQIKNRKNNIQRTKDQILLKDAEIQSKEIEKDRIIKEIKSYKNRLKISEKRESDISEEMKTVRERINETEEQLKIALAEPKQENVAISLLLYSNEIQQNLQYINTLSEKLSIEKITRENLNILILGYERETRQIDNQINQIQILKNTIKTQIEDINTLIDMINIEKEKINSKIETIKSQITFLKEKKERYDYTELIKDPTALGIPVSLSVKKGVLIAGIASLFVFSFIAFFIENITRIKSKV